MKHVYLLEIDHLKIGRNETYEPVDRLEPVGVFASEEEAMDAVPFSDCEALITKLPIGEAFLRGIGEAKHKHINGKEA